MIDLLKRVSIFEGASPELLAEVKQALKPVHLKRGEQVCRMGDTGDHLYLIRQGQVRISIREGEDHEVVLGYLGPGDYFGEMSLITGEPVSADVTATVPTALSALEGDRFRTLCDENPILYRGISRTLSHRLRESNLRKFQTNQGRVTRFVSDQPAQEGAVIQNHLLLLARALVAETHERVLLFLNTTSVNLANEDFLQNLGITIQSESEIINGVSDEDAKLHELLHEITTEKPKHKCLLGQTTEGLSVLLWASPWGESEWLCKESLNKILSRLREVFGHILVSQVGWSTDAVIGQIPPEDHLAFMVDLRGVTSQRKAARDEYNRYVPEGLRYPPRPGDTPWVLTLESLDRLLLIKRDTKVKLPESQRVYVLLLHDIERPLLDFPHVRQVLTDIAVYPLPILSSEEHTPCTDVEGPSFSITLGRRPEMARSRIARDLAGKQVGLALGGGGARGLAHIGVIKVLEEEGIPVDMLAGSSFGSVVAAAYGSGRSADRLIQDMKYHWARLGNFLLDILDYNIPRSALLRGRKIRNMIQTAMADETIEECPIPIFVVCTDLITGREVVLEKGKLGKAIWASGSLPGIFPPVRWDQYLLVDGAVLNKVPARILREKGAQVVITVNVTPERDLGLEVSNGSTGWMRGCMERLPFFRRWLSGPNIFRIVSRSMSVSGLHLSRIHSDVVDVEIKPRVDHFDFLRFDQFDQIVEAGMEATRRALPEIREALALARQD